MITKIKIHYTKWLLSALCLLMGSHLFSQAPEGCCNSINFYFTYNVTYNSAGTQATVNFNSTNPLDCKNQPMTKVTWNFGDGSPSTNSSLNFNPTYVYSLNASCATSIYTVTTVLSSGDGYDCTKTQIITIQNPNLSATRVITATNAGCKLFNLSYSGAPIPNAQWAFGDGSFGPVIPSGTPQTTSHLYPAAGTYVVTLTGTGISPCFVTKQVVVTDFVTPDFSYLAANVCSASAGLTLSIANFNTAYTYAFNINGVNVSATVASALYTAGLINGNNIVKLTITNNSGGCSTNVTKIVSIGTPAASFNVSSLNGCAGDALSVLGVLPGADLYTWTITKPDGSTTTLIGMNPNFIFNPSNTAALAGAYQISLVTTSYYPDPLNAANTITCTSVPVSKTITINTIPNPNFTFLATACGSSITLNLPTTTFTSYTLNYGDGVTVTGGSTFNTAHAIHNYASNGVYTVSLTLNNNGCISSSSQMVSATLPVLAINATQTYMCPGGNSTLTALLSSVPSGAGAITYAWTGPLGFTSSLPSITVTNPGSYVLTVTSAGACALNMTKTQVINTAVAPVASLISIGFVNCTATSASAVVEIPVNLQLQGYSVNGVNYNANFSALVPFNVIVNGLVEGVNYITVTNLLNTTCSTVLVATAVRNNPVFTLNINQPTSCGANGNANVSITSGGPAVVKWYKLIDYPATALNTGNSVSGLAQGSYVVELANGLCITKNYFSVTQPAINISTTPASNLATCAGNNLLVTVNAGFSPSSVSGSLSYNWQKVVGSVVTPISGSGNSNNLAPGTYSVKVSGNGCESSNVFTINTLNPILVGFKASKATCKENAEVEALTSGGDGNYMYSWNLTPSYTSSNVAIFPLGNIAAPVTAQVTVTDLSGCSATSSVITVTPASPVNLLNCAGVGSVSATHINACDISACVTGGTAPYTFEWYKVGDEVKTIQWTFKLKPGTPNVLIANNGTNTFVIQPPLNAAALASSLALNTDNNINTICYPTWNFTFTPGAPIPSSSSTNTVINLNHMVSETYTIANAESFVASTSGASGATVTTQNFTNGDYNLHVIDDNGCAYTFTIGALTFVTPTTFAVTFDYVWGLSPAPEVEPVVEDVVDIVLAENMIEAAAALTEAASSCMAKQSKELATTLETNCLDITNYHDDYSVSYEVKEHHYTLYYYDRAGQLTKTVPPEGVEFLSQANVNLIKNNRGSATTPTTWPTLVHRMPTTYHYNSFGQLQNQETPDGGESQFIYDSKNRLRFSQNAKQKSAVPEVFSYTKYDELGRIIEVGESSVTGLVFTNPTLPSNITSADAFNYPVQTALFVNNQITRTSYSDQTAITYYGQPQRYTQNRVSYSYIDQDPAITGDEQYTYYSYDSHGNVEWLVQDNLLGIGKNYIRYEYDLVSGKVLKVAYNENRNDRFYHKYLYDAENRLTKTLTSRNGKLWDEDASYKYYAHGPLKRNVIGEDHVQGLDYIYTIQGWLKSINTPHLNSNDDPGKDKGDVATNWSTNSVALDRNGMVLNYFDGDYKTNAASNNFLASAGVGHYNMANLLTTAGTNAPSLYNGNISSWSQSQLNIMGATPIEARTDLYKYDVLNRIKQSTSVHQNQTTGDWQNYGTASQAYKTSYTYDANGNILNLKRFDETGLAMDDIDYKYDGLINTPAIHKNRLNAVMDNINITTIGDDIEGTHNYTYDGIGNLIKETGIEVIANVTHNVTTDITWTVYGKIGQVTKAVDYSGVPHKTVINYAYDASGNRTTKRVWVDKAPYQTEETDEVTTTFYARDAQGNIMATYSKYFNITDALYKYDLLEQPIYGSDRIGQSVNKITLSSSATAGGLVSPSTGVNTLSEYQNWLTTTNKTSLLPSSINDDLCQCKVKSLKVNSPANTNYAFATQQLEFLGVANNGIAVAENLTGDLQFYVVLEKKYLGNNDACLIFDKDGHLMQGTENISMPDVNSKPVIVNITGTNTYAVISLDANQNPVYHIVDMSAAGYALVGNAGKVTTANLPMVSGIGATTKYGYHYTGLEDHINNQSIVYSTRYTPSTTDPKKGTTEILAYDFGASTNQPAEYLLTSINGCLSTEIGELQISPNGDKLAWYQHDKTIAGFKHRKGYIYTLPLSPSKLSLGGTVAIKPVSQAGNYGNGMLDFMKNNTDILYSQRGLYAEGIAQKKDRNVWKYEPLTPSQAIINDALNPSVGYLFGEIRRGKDGKLYIPNMGTPADKIHSYSNTTWNADVMSAPDLAYELASALPTQVYKIFADPSLALPTYNRLVGKKEYELKDHLGNVKMVISDIKNITSTDAIINSGDLMTPNILSYSDYYPFGQTMPGRKYVGSTDYRFGFNGKEDDSETGTIDFGARAYDARIGKWLSVDNYRKADLTPYQFGKDNPIVFVDPDGNDEFYFNIITGKTTYKPAPGVNKYFAYVPGFVDADGKLHEYQMNPHDPAAGTYFGHNEPSFTTTEGVFITWPFVVDYNDSHHTTLAKYCKQNPLLLKLIGINDPVLAKTLEIEIAGRAIAEAGSMFVNGVLLFEGGVSGLISTFEKMGSKAFSITLNYKDKGATVTIMNQAGKTESLAGKSIKTWDDVLNNPEYLAGKNVDEVASTFGFEEIVSKSETGGRQFQDKLGNIFRYNPGNPGSRHGGAKWALTGNNIPGGGKIWVGDGKFKSISDGKNAKTILVVD